MNYDVLKKGLENLEIKYDDDILQRFGAYFDILEERGGVMNLTAITGEENVSRLHFVDCAAILNCADFRNKKVIDVGSGAGFPGLPVKILEPTTDLTMLDSLNKRVQFLNDAAAAVGIEAAAIHARAEEAAADPSHRERYDIAVSRAVARLNVLSELCVPFIKVGGLFIAMKSTDSDEESAQAEGALKTLGARIKDTYDYAIDGTDIVHRAIIIEKVSPTPKTYPRRFSKIKASPLR